MGTNMLYSCRLEMLEMLEIDWWKLLRLLFSWVLRIAMHPPQAPRPIRE
jgi:hypothetical protein